MLTPLSADDDRGTAEKQRAHDAHRDEAAGARILLGRDALNIELQPAKCALRDDGVHVSLDRRVREHADLRAVQADPREADGGGDIDALREQERPFPRATAKDFL